MRNRERFQPDHTQILLNRQVTGMFEPLVRHGDIIMILHIFPVKNKGQEVTAIPQSTAQYGTCLLYTSFKQLFRVIGKLSHHAQVQPCDLSAFYAQIARMGVRVEETVL